MDKTKFADVTTPGEAYTRWEKGSILSHGYGKGKELCDMLKRELGVPANARNFEVRFAVDEAIVVRCEFYPIERDAP